MHSRAVLIGAAALMMRSHGHRIGRKRGRDSFVRSTLWAVPAKESRPLFRLGGLLLVLAAGWTFGPGCSGQDPDYRNDLAAMKTGRIQIKGTTFEVWLATSPAVQERGLMQVSADALAAIGPDPARGLPNGAQRGMLFVFDGEELRSFWMYNTITPLDIVYIRGDGVIVTTYTMAPLETRIYPSVEPAQFALEVRAGLLAELGIAAGDRVEIPQSVLKASP